MLLDQQGKLIDPRGHVVQRGRKEGGLTRVFLLRIAEASIQEIGDKLVAGTAEAAHLKQLAIAAYADVLVTSRKARDLTRAAAGVQKWLEAEKDKGQGNVVVAVNIFRDVPNSTAAIIEGNGHGSEPRPRLALDGIRFRRDGGNGGSA